MANKLNVPRNMQNEKELIPFQKVEDKIVEIRNQRVLLDRDVALLYGVQTREVNQAVRNNPQKFPEGYVLELSEQESSILRSKILTLDQSEGKGRHTKYNYKAFTEHGLYMLATILCNARSYYLRNRILSKDKLYYR